MSLERGIVTEIISGNKVKILIGTRKKPIMDIILKLSNISVRCLQYDPNYCETRWEYNNSFLAREYLRKKLIGKVIYFTYDNYTYAGVNSGQIYLFQRGSVEIINESLILTGLVTVEPSIGIQQASYVRLLAIECLARNIERANKQSNPTLQPPLPNIEIEKFKKELNRNVFGIPIPAIIEEVQSATKMRLLLLPQYKFIWLNLSGVRNGDRYFQIARNYVLLNYLQRDVRVILDMNMYGIYYGTIFYENCNIAEYLVRKGFLQCVAWNMPADSQLSQVLFDAEYTAKFYKVNIWKYYKAEYDIIYKKEQNVVGIVTKINKDFSLTVESNKHPFKVYFASLKLGVPAVQLVNNDQQVIQNEGCKNLVDNFIMTETREFLEAYLIEKTVVCTLDYTEGIKPLKYFYSVYLGQTNFAELLLHTKLARLIHYNEHDFYRSAKYFHLKALSDSLGLPVILN